MVMRLLDGEIHRNAAHARHLEAISKRFWLAMDMLSTREESHLLK